MKTRVQLNIDTMEYLLGILGEGFSASIPMVKSLPPRMRVLYYVVGDVRIQNEEVM